MKRWYISGAGVQDYGRGMPLIVDVVLQCHHPDGRRFYAKAKVDGQLLKHDPWFRAQIRDVLVRNAVRFVSDEATG